MSFKDTNFFGLNTSKALTDIGNTSDAIYNLNLNELDIAKIYGTANDGAVKTDFRSLSELDQYLQRSVVAYSAEVALYSDILGLSADPSNTLRGNLSVEGVLGGSALKYQYWDDVTTTMKIADISTSRTSSWSSPVPTPITTSPIQYGLNVELSATAKLETPNLELFRDVQDVIFPDSEKPTHKIKVVMDGFPVYVYVMKNLPLIFEGQFKSLEATCELFTPDFVSWRILYTDNLLLSQSFENQGGETTESILVAEDTRTRNKNIEIYANPDNYKLVDVQSAGIRTLPKAQLTSLLKLNLANNDLNTFPDFNFFAPNLSEINLANNNFTLGDEIELRRITQNVISRLPSTLTSLNLKNCFSGSIDNDVIKDGLPSLQKLDLTSQSYLKLQGPMPSVNASTISEYIIGANIFTGDVPQELLDSESLTVYDVSDNETIDLGIFDRREFSSQILTLVNITGTHMQIPDLRNRPLLERFIGTQLKKGAYLGTFLVDSADEIYPFENCTSLKDIDISFGIIKGFLPTVFKGNTSLTTFKAVETKIKGTYDTEFALDKNMFDDCLLTLEVFEFSSSDLSSQTINTEVFKGCEKLNRVYLDGLGGSFDGSIPDISDNVLLNTFILTDTSVSGNVWPSISANGNFSYINLSNNQLSGTIPKYNNNNLQYLYLNNNDFTEFKAQVLPNLLHLYVHFNNIQGTFPDLSNLVNLQILYANNNQFDDYDAGSLATLGSVAKIELSDNSFGSAAVNLIINDLYINYENNNRSGVIVNLGGNATPGVTAQQQIAYLQSNGWSIVTS